MIWTLSSGQQELRYFTFWFMKQLILYRYGKKFVNSTFV